MSWLVVAVVIVGCNGKDLHGTTRCYNGFSCGSGQLCHDQFMGALDDGGISTNCITAPADCDLSDCAGSACPACVRGLCEPPYDQNITVEGRYLRCLP